MAPDDDDFWTAYIAATPEEDNDFRGVGHILWPIAVVLATMLIVALLW